MKGLRNMRAMMIGVGLIIVTNAIVLAGVSYNRSGEPESTITLTERELRLPYRYSGNDENSGIHLRINYRRGSGYFSRDYKQTEIFAWFNKEKLAALGFDVSQPFIQDEDKRHYQRLREKEVFLVLEYNGMAYQGVLKETKKHYNDLLAEQSTTQNNGKISNARSERVSYQHSDTMYHVPVALDREP